MKTISLRELHNNTGKWVRAVKKGGEIAVTDRGEEIAMIVPKRAQVNGKVDWKNRKLVPAFAKYLREGKVGTDSTKWISEERSAMDNRGAND